MIKKECGNCRHIIDINTETLKLICKKHNLECDHNSKICKDFKISYHLLNKYKECGVCIYCMMDDYCLKHEWYIQRTNICKDFEPVEEFEEGLL